MTVSVRLFAALAEAAGRDTLVLTDGAGSTPNQLWQRLRAELPGLERWPEPPLVAVNQEYADPNLAIDDGDDVAFLPPIAGG